MSQGWILMTTGTVAVKLRTDWSDEECEPFVILLAGPTGSGKSSFIEALGNDKSLGISKDQLEGFTQTVTAYHVKNMEFIEALGNDKSLGISKDQLEGFTQTVTAYHVKNMEVKGQYGTTPVCLLDSPGFSDTNISEMEIIEQ
ncbi:hypothetical protein CVT24_004185, partial [Panaeolus cyanescens]